MLKLMLVVVLTLLTLVAVPVRSYGQQGSTASDSIVKACEQAVDELKVARIELAGLKEQIRLRDERDKLRDQFEANQAEQITFWKTAALERKDALNLDNRIDAIRIEQIAEYKDEVNRLRIENDKLRKGKSKWFLAGLVLGAVVPKLP